MSSPMREQTLAIGPHLMSFRIDSEASEEKIRKHMRFVYLCGAIYKFEVIVVFLVT